MSTLANRDVVVIGASAGGLEPLTEIVASLPVGFPAAIFVVVHTAAGSQGGLAQILRFKSQLPVEPAVDGEYYVPGRIYVARPDQHLLLDDGIVRSTHGPKENSFRPAVDPLFRTAARATGPRVIGILLSGGMNDGTVGLREIKKHGGLAVVQHPEEALVPSMPLSALRYVEVDHVLRCAEIAEKLPELVAQQVRVKEQHKHVAPGASGDVAVAGSDKLLTGEMTGDLTPFTCPECGGVLSEFKEVNGAYYRCHVGHGFTPEALSVEQHNKLEAALWTALRSLDEHAALYRRMTTSARREGFEEAAAHYDRRMKDLAAQGEFIRGVLQKTPENELEPRPPAHPGNGGKAGGEKPPKHRSGNGSGNP
jgi:two-component system chemotaxis response regulator CheB